MSITTIRPTKKPFNYKILVGVLAVILVKMFVIYTYQDQVAETLGFYKKASISVLTSEPEVEVFINNKSVGKTPLVDFQINPSLVNITLKRESDNPKDLGANYTTNFKAIDGSENFIYRELGFSKDLSSGVSIWEDKLINKTSGEENTDESSFNTTKRLELFLNPSDSKISVDGKELGLSDIERLGAGDYSFMVSKESYQDLSFQVSIREGYKSIIEIQLRPLPYDNEIVKYQDFDNVFVVKSSNPDVYSYTKTWLEYLNHFREKNGLKIEGTGTTGEDIFDYYVDRDGKVYGKKFSLIDNFDLIDSSMDKKFAFLHKGVNREVVTQKNSFTLIANLPKKKLASTKKIESQVLGSSSNNQVATRKIKITGEWLRIRSEPNGEEIGRAKEGETYELISDATPGWYQIKLEKEKTGYISVLYSEELKN